MQTCVLVHQRTGVCIIFVNRYYNALCPLILRYVMHVTVAVYKQIHAEMLATTKYYLY